MTRDDGTSRLPGRDTLIVPAGYLRAHRHSHLGPRRQSDGFHGRIDMQARDLQAAGNETDAQRSETA
jgi:hypothetical protein